MRRRDIDQSEIVCIGEDPACPNDKAAGPLADDLVTVGNLNSSARGTGARKNAGKPDWSQFPLWTISEVYELFNWVTDEEDDSRGPEDYTGRIDIELGKWQRGDDHALEYAAVAAMNLLVIHGVCKDMYDILSLVVRVLEFGEKKYKKGNWAKGMPWSVCYTCAVSHFMKYASGRTVDEESGIHTLAHLLCNVLFLLAYRDLYPEGDDRMPEFSEPEEKEFYGLSFVDVARYAGAEEKLFDLGPFVPLEPHT